MHKEIIDIFKSLVAVPSPSGFEMSIKSTIKDMVASYVDQIVEDVHGNLICYKYGKSPESNKTLMLVAHMDEVGLMVNYIEDSGFVRFSTIGGVDINILKGQRVLIKHGECKISGVIGVQPIHMKHRSNNRDVEISDLWIDIGVDCKEDAQRMVSIGDSIVLDSDMVKLSNSIVTSRGCDDKAGVTVLVKVLEMIANTECNYNVVAVASVQEEVGLKGARTSSYFVSPDVCIAIDVAHATDYPSVNKAMYGDVRLGKGPVIPVGSDFTPSVQNKLREIASQIDKEYQIVGLPGFSGTDANSVQVSKGGCATGLVSIPCRYMHTPVEVVSLSDIESVCHILYEFCKLKN